MGILNHRFLKPKNSVPAPLAVPAPVQGNILLLQVLAVQQPVEGQKQNLLKCMSLFHP